jgi:hypothetical protein
MRSRRIVVALILLTLLLAPWVVGLHDSSLVTNVAVEPTSVYPDQTTQLVQGVLDRISEMVSVPVQELLTLSFIP